MPVAAIAGALLGMIAIGLIMWIGMKLQGGFREDGWYFLYIMPVFTSGAFGYLYAKIAYAMAPSGKLIAGVVMVTILGLLGLIGAVLAWLMPDYTLGYAIQTTIGTIATIIGAVIALVDPTD